MQAFTTVSGIAAPLPAANIDTDVIMPKQFLKGIDRSNLDRGIFFDLRFRADGSANPDFVLNVPAWRGAKFLVVGNNFGCGSSREHAVWGLAQLGIRALIGTSFAGIFFDNCARNGLLALVLPPEELQRLLQAATNAQTNTLSIDLERQTITAPQGAPIRFEIEPARKQALLLGLDAIASTLLHRAQIRDFEQTYFAERSWLTTSPVEKGTI